MKMPLLLTLLALLTFGTACCTQQVSAQQETIEFNPIDEMRIPAHFVPMVLDELKKQGLDHLPLNIELVDGTGKPVSGREIKARWDGGEATLESNTLGRLEFALNRDNYKQLVLEIPSQLKAKMDSSGMSIEVEVSDGDGEADAKVLDLEKDFQMLGDKNLLKVYYPQGQLAVAQKAYSDLAEMRGFVRGHAGIALAENYGIALLAEMQAASVKGQIVIPASSASWGEEQEGNGSARDEDFKRFTPWFVLHEWFESTLVFGNGLYSQDPKLRYVGDGLAEFYSGAYTSYRHPDSFRFRLQMSTETLVELLAEGRLSYELTELFLAETSAGDGGSSQASGLEVDAGYPLSFVFWTNFSRKYGEGAIRKVVEKIVSAQGTIDESKMAAVLKEVAGEEVTTTIDVAAALKTIQRMLDE